MNLGLRSAGFVCYLVTQFLGVLNDNAFKYLIIFLVLKTVESDADQGAWTGGAQVAFAAPFILFAVWAGGVADRVGKTSVIRAMKVAEVLLMGLAIGALASGSLVLVVVLLFLMSTQSAFFGPAKYGFLVEAMGEQRLVQANGVVQMTTMLAAVVGTWLGARVYDTFADTGLGAGAIVFVAVALVGLATSMGVPKLPAARPEERLPRNPFPILWETWSGVRGNPTLLYTVLGIGHFWLLVALMQVDLADYGITEMGMSAEQASLFQVTAVVGIALGSLLAGRWSEEKVEMGLVPLGSFGMSLAILVLAIVEPGYALPLGATFVMGLAGGLLIVPLQALIQIHSPDGEKGRYIAFGNMVSFIGILLSALFIWLPRELGLTIRQQLLVVAAVSAAGTCVSLKLLPYAFVRFCAWLLAHSLYRIRVLHPERLPTKGGALLLANHTSWVDALILPATTRRSMHFLMHRSYYEWWPTHWLFKLVGCIPVGAGDAPGTVQSSLEEAGRHLDEGKIVIVFAEGAVTRLGHMLPFRTGYQRIIQGRDAPVIPVHLDGLWGSIFSHAGGRLIWKIPRAFPYPVTVTFGEPLAPEPPTHAVRRAIRKLSIEAWEDRKRNRLPLPLTLLREVRWSFRRALFEADGRGVSPAAFLALSQILASRLAHEVRDCHHVGVLGVQGIDMARAVVALQLLGKVPAPMDARVPGGDLRDMVHDAALDAVLVLPGALEGVDVEQLPPVIELDPITRVLTRWHVRRRMLVNALVPFTILGWRARRLTGSNMDAPAAILFATHATGRPRPALLSHFNIISNVEGIRHVVDVTGRDGVLGVLPLSQSFGFVTTFWFPLLSGLSVAWHADPSEGRDVGRLAEKHRLTILPATPRLLAHFAGTTRPANFGGLRLVWSGLERLPAAVRRDFNTTFGIVPREVYTSTEATAIVAINNVNVRTIGVFQRGHRTGTMGHPLPGVLVDVVDPKTLAPLPYDASGLVRVRGSNVMRGYVDEAGAEDVLRDGALVIGDWGSIDEDGFVMVEDRSRRRSRIRQVAVSHRAVEEAIAAIVGPDVPPVVVLARNDGQGGEELVVCYERGSLEPRAVAEALADSGTLPAEALPDVANFVPIEGIGVTASGVVDLLALRATVSQRE